MQEKPSKWRASLIAGLAIGAVSGIPVVSLINCCCCAGILGGGVLAYLFVQEEHKEGMIPLESSDGLILGIMAGVIGAFAQAVIHGIIILLFAGMQEELMRSIFAKIIERLERSGSVPSETIDQLRDQIENSMKESNTMWGFLGSLFMTLIVYPIFAMLGGLLGYGIFKRKQVQTPAAPTFPS